MATVCREQSNSAAICKFGGLSGSAARRTIRARKANDCGVDAAREILSNGSRCSSANETSAAKGRGMASLLALEP
jgi:hypothetical protein